MAVGSKGTSGGGGPRSQNKTKQVETTQQSPAPAKGTPKVSEVVVPVKPEVTPKTEPQKIQPTAEQLRLAQITASSRKDDPDIEEKVQQLVDLSSRSADACLSALYDADYDMERAIEILLEGGEDTWEVSGKKKKQKPAKPAVPEPTEEELQGPVDKRNDISSWDRDDRGSRTRGGAPPRFRGRGRGRDGFSDGPERGRGGRGRGRGGARGGRGGYRGGGPSEATVFDSPMETWGGAPQEKQEEELKVDNWGDDFPAAEDWDNEEYTVSLADTKVFTASSVAIQEKTVTVVESTLANGDKFHEPEPVKAPPAPVGSLTHQSHQSLDLNLLLQKSSSTVQQQNQSSYLSSYTQQASETLKAAIGVGVSAQQSSNSLFTSTQVVQGQFSPNTQLQQQRAKLAKPKLPPPSKIPSSAVEMPDDSVSQLDIQFGGLEFGADSASVEFGSTEQNVGYGNDNHALLSNKTESYGGSAPSAPVAPASQSQQKPSAFATGTPTYTQQQAAYTSTQSGQTVSTASQPIASQATSTYQTSSNYQSSFQSGAVSNYGSAVYSASGYPSTGYGTAPATVNKLAGAASTQSYDTTTVTSSSTSSMSAGSFGLTPSASAAQAAAPAAAPVSAVSQRVAPVTGSGMQAVASSVGKGVGMPPGVPTQMLGQYVMSQAPPGLPFAYAGLAQQPIYSMEDVQNMQYLQRYQQPMSNTTALGARDTGLAGYDPSKFQRNDNNSPVPAATTLTGQAGGTQYISPAAPTQLAAAPTYAYFYSNLPSGFQYGAPAAAIYPVSAATTGATVSSYKSPSASQAPYGYGGYDNSDYTKTAYVNQSMAKTASDMGVGASVHGKTAAYQLGKSAYEKGFHTGTPPPFGMTGGSAAHLGNPVAAGYPQMFVPAMPHQSAASALIHQQLHGDNVNSQRASAAGQAKGAPSAKPYGGSYWGN